MVIIYALLDPRDNQIRYIGKTKNLEERISGHLVAASKNKTYKDKWLKSIVILGLSPKIKTLEIVDDNIWQRKERYYIKYYKNLGCKLTNMTEGGEGIIMTEEIKKKIGEAQERRKEKLGYINSLEARKKMSEAKKGRKLSDETKRRIGESNKGKKRNKEFREKLRQANLGKKWSENSRKKLSLSRKGYVWREESKDKLRKKILQYNKDDKLIKEFLSITDAAEELGSKKFKGDICRCLKGGRKSAYGYIWKYKDKVSYS